jgi:hypothetical protein
MVRRSSIFIILFLLLLLPQTVIFAQQKEDTVLIKKDTSLIKKEDTTLVKENATDTSGKSLLSLDTATKKFNPSVATLRSLILPGWGQWYNKKYWKIPIVYGALGVTAGVFFYNLKTYRLLRQGVIYLSDTLTSNDRLVDPQFTGLSLQSLRFYRNAYRQNIDYSVLVFLVFWGLNVVDATVDAHLKAFDVSPNIGMRIQPGKTNMNNAAISFVFFFKDKSNKPLLPLP